MSFPAIAIGGHLSVSVGDRLVCGVWRRAPSGEQASKPLSDSRQQPFCNFVSKVVRGAGNGPDQTVKMGTKPRNSRVLAQMKKCRVAEWVAQCAGKAASEPTDSRTDRSVNDDSRRDLIDRDPDFPSSTMFKGAISPPVCLCSHGFACTARFDSVDPLANLTDGDGGCPCSRRYRRFASSGHHLGGNEARAGRRRGALYIDEWKGWCARHLSRSPGPTARSCYDAI